MLYHKPEIGQHRPKSDLIILQHMVELFQMPQMCWQQIFTHYFKREKNGQNNTYTNIYIQSLKSPIIGKYVKQRLNYTKDTIGRIRAFHSLLFEINDIIENKTKTQNHQFFSFLIHNMVTLR